MNGCSSTYQSVNTKDTQGRCKWLYPPPKMTQRTTGVCVYTTTIDNIDLNRYTSTYIHLLGVQPPTPVFVFWYVLLLHPFILIQLYIHTYIYIYI